MSRPDIEANPPKPNSTAAQRERDNNDSNKINAEHVEKLDTIEVYDDEMIAAKRRDVIDSDARGYVDPDLQISPEEDKRIRWMIHKRSVKSDYAKSTPLNSRSVLPIMCCVYIVQALDKGALGPVSIMGKSSFSVLI